MSIIEYNLKKRRKRVKKTLQFETKSAVRSLIITLTSMIIVLSIAFLAITNQGAQKGYALEQAKLKNEKLLNQNELLKNKITNSTTASKIESNEKISEMTQDEEKDYVTKEDNMVN